jgi:ABC-type transport system involved in multi-copper enzyme maturation permease subunit
MNLLPLLRFEITKLLGRRLTWVPYIVLSIVVGIIVLVFHNIQFNYQKRLFATFQFAFKSKEEFVNGYYMAAHGMNPIFQVLIPIFIAVASGLMIAGEAEQGTLRACLIRPISRRQLILGKFIVLCGYALSISFFLLAILITSGLLNFGTGNLYTLNILFNNGQEGASMVPAAEAPMRFVLAGLIAALGMTVLGALALLISALVDTAAMAYVLTLSVYFALLTLRSFPFLEWLYPYLLVTHMLSWQQCFYSYVKTGDILVSLVHLVGYLIVFLWSAIVLFSARDVKS